MNYYERIQKSINYIEDNLFDDIVIENLAKVAFMSIAVFYRMFFSIVGFTAKEYIRNRRFDCATSTLLHTDKNVMMIASECGYKSADAFSRAFQSATGLLPSNFRQNKSNFSFARVDIIKKYFELGDKEMIEKYPDIKVLKEVPPMKVAYYNYIGKNPEKKAFDVMMKWVSSQNQLLEKTYRIFGYNNPNPTESNPDNYGYEVCVTIDENTIIDNYEIKTKTLSGGLYATVHVTAKNREIGYDVMDAWARINAWIADSKYEFGEHQYFEEYLTFNENIESIKEIELYIPIKPKTA